MTGNNKRRWRWSSKGLFGPRIHTNQTARDGDSVDETCSSTNPATLDSRSMGNRQSIDVRSAVRLPSKKRRTHSKLLSAMGFQQDKNIDNNGQFVGHTLEQHYASDDKENGNQVLSSPLDREDAEDELEYRDALLGTKTSPIGAPQIEPPTSLKLKSRDVKGPHPKTSNHSLAHQLSHKLSQTFGNPTVVHRPNLRVKPSLNSLQRAPSFKSDSARDEERSQQDSTAPSTCNYSGSVSPKNPSTGKTSLESVTGTPRSVKVLGGGKEVNSDVNKTDTTENKISREQTLSPIQEAPNPITPTFVTVETTANAKIFFETYFNSLLAGHSSPRSLRRRDLEIYFETLSIPEEQREVMRWAWASQESDHLRQSRVLKTKFNKSRRERGISVAGYEVVRILGKGSFGVVRLVREKDTVSDPQCLNRYIKKLSSTELHHHDSQDENARSKMSNSRTHISSFDIQASAQQQPDSGPSRRNVYAMKVIRKSDMLRNCQEGHLRAERDFLVAMEKSRWVVPLIASFQDDTNLYLVMEYMVGGDFLGFLFRKDKLKEKQARWYIAEMILCVEETHRSRWIHRDIKPDNFLISSSGHLKISDFGLAFDGHWAHDQKYYKNTRTSLMETLGISVKGDFEDQKEDEKRKPRSSLATILTGWRGGEPSYPKVFQLDGPNERESILQWKNRTGKRRMAASVVGTSQYMAPEVIRGDPYDGRCDWWSIGIILYECLYGFTPFVCEKREDTKAKILDNAHSLSFPKERDVERNEKVSFEAMDLINSLLQEKEHRLSSSKYKINDWKQARYSSSRVMGRCADPVTQDYPGNFVYPDDACDIKAHPFFDRISWERLHLTRPPWVPQVIGNDDTQWFDDEEGVPISDVHSTASGSEVGTDTGRVRNESGRAVRQVRQVDGAEAPGNKYHSPPNEKVENEVPRGNGERAKAKRRPRDKVLRDKEVGRKALELRKRGAFLGYTYRRPKLLSFEDEREKHRPLQRTLIPNFE